MAQAGDCSRLPLCSGPPRADPTSVPSHGWPRGVPPDAALLRAAQQSVAVQHFGDGAALRLGQEAEVQQLQLHACCGLGGGLWGAGGGVSAAQPWGPQWGGQRAASPPSAMRWGHPGAKTPPPTPPPPPEHGTDPPVPLPPRHRDCPAAVCQRRSLLPLPLPAELPGDGGGHRKGCGTRPPDPPKGTPLGCQHQHYTAVWPPDPKRSGGLWLPSQPHVCPHPSPGGVRGVPTQCEVPGGGSTGPGTGIVHSGDSGQWVWVALHHGHHHGTEGGARWHGGRGGKPWGLWWHGDHNGTP